MSSIKKNLGFQTAYQILNTCLPLITAPYLARVLGASQLGVFSYTSSIVAYFTLVAMLGTVNYGTRSIATVKGSREERSRIFWGIYLFQMLVSFIALILYIGYLLMVCNDNRIVATIQIISIIDCFFNINWLFFGIENFKLTVTRNIVIKLVTVVAILLFVKHPGDLWKYTTIMLAGTLISDGVLWFYLPTVVDFKPVKPKEIVKHIGPNIILFVPLLAMSVYHTMDKTMLGILSTYEESGFYYNADKVINIPVNILGGIGTVMLPRMTSLISVGNKREGDKLFLLSLEGVTAVSVAIAVGIAAVSTEFVPLFFGEGYDTCIMLIIVLAPVLIIKGFSLTARNQYLIPYKLEYVFIQSVIIGAIVNVCFNAILIPKLGAMGAVIGTFLAEFSACALQFAILRRYVSVQKAIRNCIGYIVIGIIMFVVVRIVSIISIPLLVKLAIEIVCGACVYIILCFLFWKITRNSMYEEVFGSIIKKLHICL